MDYDLTNMAEGYDKVRQYSRSGRELWQKVILESVEGVSIENIVDVGCGTGRYSAILADSFDADILAVDPSEKMLSEARLKSLARVSFKKGSAQDIPASDGAFDMLFMSMVLHHVDDQAKALNECARVLRDGGVMCLRALTSDRISEYPFTSYFPSVNEIFDGLLSSRMEMVLRFEDVGFVLESHRVVENLVAPNLTDFADKIAAKPYSTLARLTDEEFSEGLEKLRHAAEGCDMQSTVTEPIDYFVFQKAS